MSKDSSLDIKNYNLLGTSFYYIPPILHRSMPCLIPRRLLEKLTVLCEALQSRIFRNGLKVVSQLLVVVLLLHVLIAETLLEYLSHQKCDDDEGPLSKLLLIARKNV